MKNFLSFSVLFLFIASANAQFGVAFKYEKNNYSEWNNKVDFENDRIFQNDVSIGVNYWFRLKKHRIEFLPEISYTLKNTEKSISGIVPSPIFEMDLTRIGLQFHTQIYPMDLEGDCNCPTWGKDNDFIKKGLYFSLSPGIDYLIPNATFEQSDVELDPLIAFKIGAGLGIDIGINKQFTISPFILFNYYPSIDGKPVEDLFYTICGGCEPFIDYQTSNTQVNPGIRLIFRPDYKY